MQHIIHTCKRIAYLMASYNSQSGFLGQRLEQGQQIYYDEVIVGGVELQQVTPFQMKSRLHKNIVVIIIRRNNFIIGRGSGLLISRNLVLTCAHNLLHNKELLPCQWIEIYPGAYGVLQRPYSVEGFRLPSQFRNKPKFDYALIKLAQKVGSDDFLPLKCNFKHQEQELAIFGYPETNYHLRESAFQYGLRMYKAVVQIRLQAQQIIHLISTKVGQSGSPIIQLVGDQMNVIGVHKGGIEYKEQLMLKQHNHGKLLTQNTLQILFDWAEQLNAEPFRISEDTNSFIPPKINQNYYTNPQLVIQVQKTIYQFEQNNSKINGQKQAKVERYLNSIKLDPDSFNDYNLLGNAYMDLNNIQQAKFYFSEAIQIKPDFGYAYSGMGNAYKAEKNPKEAILYYRKAIAFTPENIWAQIGLGHCYRELKDYKRAREHFIKAIQIDPTHSDPHQQYGKFLYQIQEIPEAIQQYQLALECDKKNVWAYNGLGASYVRLDRLQQASRNLLKAIELLPVNCFAYHNLGMLLQRMNRREEALWFLQKCGEMNPSYPDINLKITRVKVLQ